MLNRSRANGLSLPSSRIYPRPRSINSSHQSISTLSPPPSCLGSHTTRAYLLLGLSPITPLPSSTYPYPTEIPAYLSFTNLHKPKQARLAEPNTHSRTANVPIFNRPQRIAPCSFHPPISTSSDPISRQSQLDRSLDPPSASHQEPDTIIRFHTRSRRNMPSEIQNVTHRICRTVKEAGYSVERYIRTEEGASIRRG